MRYRTTRCSTVQFSKYNFNVSAWHRGKVLPSVCEMSGATYNIVGLIPFNEMAQCWIVLKPTPTYVACNIFDRRCNNMFTLAHERWTVRSSHQFMNGKTKKLSTSYIGIGLNEGLRLCVMQYQQQHSIKCKGSSATRILVSPTTSQHSLMSMWGRLYIWTLATNVGN